MSENAYLILLCLFIAGLPLLAVAVITVYAALVAYVRWKYAHIPSPKTASFFLGHAYELQQFKRQGNGENPPDKQYAQWAFEVGNVYVLFLYWKAKVVVLNPADIETITASIPQKTREIERFVHLFGERLLGDGLFTLRNYEVWKTRRRLYESAFNESHLKGLIPNFCASTDLLLEKLTEVADGTTKVSLKRHIHEATVDVISKVIFSSDFNPKWKSQCTSTTVPLKERGLDFLMGEAFRGIEISHLNPFFKYLHPFQAKHYWEIAKALRTIGRDCIMSRIDALNDDKDVPLDVLSHLLRAAFSNGTVDIETLVDEFVTFYIGGVENTANLVLFALIQAHQQKNVLNKLLSEIKNVLGDKNIIRCEDLDKLKYTEQVIEEAMRMPGLVGGGTRECPRGGIILSGHHIPGGTILQLHTGAMCRMSQFFENPNTFNPSRFDPANKRPSPNVYFPFGVGHRSCLAKHFAMMAAKLLISRLVQNFEITLPEGYTMDVVERSTKYLRDDALCTLLPRL